MRDGMLEHAQRCEEVLVTAAAPVDAGDAPMKCSPPSTSRQYTSAACTLGLRSTSRRYCAVASTRSAFVSAGSNKPAYTARSSSGSFSRGLTSRAKIGASSTPDRSRRGAVLGPLAPVSAAACASTNSHAATTRLGIACPNRRRPVPIPRAAHTLLASARAASHITVADPAIEREPGRVTGTTTRP
jgi:hypothetical protein